MKRRLVWIFGLMAVLALAVGCAGGSGGGARGVLPPSAAPAGLLDVASREIPLSQTNVPLALPSVSGVGSTIELPQNDAAPGAQIAVYPTSVLPSFVAGALPDGSVLFEAFTLLASDDVTFSGRPQLSLLLPAAPANKGANFAWIYDTAGGWSTYSAVNVSGNRLTAGGGAEPLHLLKGVAYVVAVLSASAVASCPTPTPRPTATDLPSPQVSPARISTAFVLNFDPGTSIGRVSAFSGGNYDRPAYEIPVSSPSTIRALPDGTLFILERDACTIRRFAAGSTTPQMISVSGCAENFSFDRNGNLYAIAGNGAEIVELQAGSYTTVLRTIPAKSGFKFHAFPAIIGGVSSLAFDSANDVFAVEYADADRLSAKVEEFAPGGTSSIRTVSLSNYPRTILVDSTGELYAGAAIYQGAILGYSPGGSTPNVVIPATLNEQIALDAADHLFAYSYAVPAVIDEYAPRSGALVAQATVNRANASSAFAIDPAGNIWAADGVQFPVLIYPGLDQTPTGATVGASYVQAQWTRIAEGFAFVP